MADTQDEMNARITEGEWISEALAGAVFPLPRRHVLWVAMENGVPPAHATALQKLPEGEYRDLQAVLDALGAVQPLNEDAESVNEPGGGGQPGVR